MIKNSLEHLKENNMTYISHFKFAFTHGVMCVIAGIYLCLHAIVPAIFSMAGSKLVNKLNKSFIDHNELLKSRLTDRR